MSDEVMTSSASKSAYSLAMEEASSLLLAEAMRMRHESPLATEAARAYANAAGAILIMAEFGDAR